MAEDIASIVKRIGDAPIEEFQPVSVHDAERAIKTLQIYIAFRKPPGDKPPPSVQKLVESVQGKVKLIANLLDTPTVEAIQSKPPVQEDPRVHHSIAVEGRDDPSLTNSIRKYLGEDSLRREFEVARSLSIQEDDLKIPKSQSRVKRYVDNTSAFIDKIAAARAIHNGIKIRVFELICERKLFQGDPPAIRPALASTLGMILSFVPRQYRTLLEGHIETLVDVIGGCLEIMNLARQKYTWRLECSTTYGDGCNRTAPINLFYHQNLPASSASPLVAFRNDGRAGYAPPFSQDIIESEMNPESVIHEQRMAIGVTTPISMSGDDYWMHFSHSGTGQIIDIPGTDYTGMFPL